MADLTGGSKEELLRALAERASQHSAVSCGADQILSALLNRERLGSTGVGEGVAIPHAKIPGMTELVACVGRVPGGVPFDAIDQKPVRLVFLLLVPENSAGAHLKALARVSRLLKDADFRAALLAQPDARGIYDTFLSEDAKG